MSVLITSYVFILLLGSLGFFKSSIINFICWLFDAYVGCYSFFCSDRNVVTIPVPAVHVGSLSVAHQQME
jgi:hypothetical protein